MASLADYQANKKRTILLYGKAGAGKTSLALSFPGRTMVFDFDQKLGSGAAVMKAKEPERLAEIDYHTYGIGSKTDESHRIFRRPFQQFAKELNEFEAKISEYDNIVLDSLTAMAYFLMEEEMMQRPGKADRDKMNGVQVPNMKDYQVSIQYFKNLMQNLISLPVNLIVTAHDAAEKDENTGVVTNTLAIWGKDLPVWIPKTFEEVYYVSTKSDFKTKESKRFIQTSTANRFIGRSQIYGMPLEVCVDDGYKALKRYYEA